MIVAHSVRQRWLAQTQTWLYDLVRFLPRSLVESHVVCPEVENLDQFPVAHLHSRSRASLAWRAGERLRRKLGSARRAGFLRDTLRSLEPALVHSHFAPQGWEDLEAVRELGVPHVTSFYGFDVTRLPREDPVWQARYAELFDAAAAVLCEGPFMADCIRALGCPAEKLRVHRLGVDLEGIEFRPRRWDGREPLRVLLAAAFREKKGLPLAIEALGRLQPEVPLEVTLVGDATDAPGSQREKRRILAALERSGLDARTRLRGFLGHAELIELALGCHIYLAPSLTAADGDSEGGAPVALIQMAASGIVVVSSDHCDIPQVVRPGETGFLCAEGEVDSLERELRAALEARESWAELADAARRHVAEGFDGRARGAGLATIYQSIVGDFPSRSR